MNNKIELSLSNKEYHEGPGLSASGLKQFAISPAHFQEYKGRPQKEEVKLESLVHLFLLEPHTFDDSYACVADRRTKAGKQEYADAIEAGKHVVKQDDVDQAKIIAAKVMENAECKNLLTTGVNEASIFVHDESLNIDLKIRPDIWLESEDMIVDVKTVSRGMSKYSIENLMRIQGWDIQAAFYLNVIYQYTGKEHTFVHMFVEKDAPYGVRLMQMDLNSCSNATDYIAPYLSEYQKCLQTNFWGGYEMGITPMSVNRYVEVE